MTFRPALALSLALFPCLSACGFGDGTDSDESARFSAHINGVAWAADNSKTSAHASPWRGEIQIGGAGGSSLGDLSFKVDLYNISGPGTYPLGVGNTVSGGTLSVYTVDSTGLRRYWSTPLSGAAGSITFTKLSSRGVIGTFAGVLEPNPDNDGEAMEITEGRFALPLEGVLDTLPGPMGNRITAALNGIPFQAAGVTVMNPDQLVGPGLQFTATTDRWSLNLLLRGAVDTGTYPLRITGPVRLLSAVDSASTPDTYWGLDGSGHYAGVVVVTSLTSDRARGNFTASLSHLSGPANGTSLILTDGEFDIAIR